MKVGTMHFDAQSANLLFFNPVKVHYEPKQIHSEAIAVTMDNIGKLALEFDAELLYRDNSLPYFMFKATRFGDDDQPLPTPRTLYVRVGDWIVPLWGELHIYRDREFQNTFLVEPTHVLKDVRLFELGFTQQNGPQHSKTDETGLSPNNRVKVLGTDIIATVTVVGVHHEGYQTLGVEVLHADGTYSVYQPADLEKVDVDIPPHSGQVQGPNGTGIMPRVDQ